MLVALWRQARADLRSRKLQAAQLLLILTTAAMTLTFTVMIERGAEIIWNHLFFDSIGAHATFIARDSDVDLTRIQRLDAVAVTSGPNPVLRDLALLQDPMKMPLSLYATGLEPPSVARPLLTHGRWPRADDEIMLEAAYARELSLTVGDRVHIITPERQHALTLVGQYVSTSSTYPQSFSVSGYVLESTLPSLQPDRRRWEQALDVRLRGGDSTAFVEQVHRLFSPGEIVGSRTWRDSFGFVRFFNDITSLGFHLFSLFTLVAVAIIVGNSASGFAIARFRDIGLLKAIGFTPALATSLLVAEHLAIGLVASLAGIALGLLFAPFIFPSPYLRTAVEYLPSGWPLLGEPLLWLGVLLVLETVVALATAGAVWRGVGAATVSALSAGLSTGGRTPSGLAKLASRMRLPLVISLGLRNVFSQPWRGPLTVIALVLTIATATVALSADSVLRAFVERPGLVGEPASNLLVTSAGMRDEEVRALLASRPEITTAGFFRLDAQSTDRGLPIALRGVGPGAGELGLVVLEGRSVQQPGEAIVAQGLLDALGLRIGDELRLMVQGRPLAVRIVGRFYSSWNRGVVAVMSAETLLAEVDAALRPEGYFVRLTPGTDPFAVRALLLAASGSQIGVRVWETPEAQQGLRAAFFTVSVGLLLIGAITLFNATWLAVQERTRDLGILKAIGLTPHQIVVSVVSGAALQAFVAAIGGAALGYVVTQLLYDFAMSQQGGGGGGIAPVNWPLVLLLVVIGVELIVIASSALPARQAARIQASDVLRHE
jgi:putative ABC transport system permease protein